MPTDKQREASRLNSLKSTGPRTLEGKAISSKNAFKLGICLSDAAFYQDPQSRNHINRLLSEYESAYKPQSPFERDALEEIALCTVRLNRLHRVEEGLYTEGMEKAYVTHTITGKNGELIHRFEKSIYPPHERSTVDNIHLAAAWRPANDLFETITRQENRISLRLRRAQQRYAELVKQRLSQPVQAEETIPVQEENTPGKNEAGNDLTPIPAAPIPAPPQPASPPPDCPNPDKEAA